MNEVEKLMQNANVEREFAYLECHRGRSSICCPIVEYEKDDECMGCINSSAMEKVYEYPPFTAEKQLELIKFLLDKYCDIRIRKNLEGEYYIKSFNDISCFSEDFEETLASFMNTHLQDLTEEERKQIKEILE